jgi:hypothetical protein
MPTVTIEANNSHEITESLKFSLRQMRWLSPNGGDMNGNTIDAGIHQPTHEPTMTMMQLGEIFPSAVKFAVRVKGADDCIGCQQHESDLHIRPPRCLLPQSSSASRLTAGALGFFIFTQ